VGGVQSEFQIKNIKCDAYHYVTQDTERIPDILKDPSLFWDKSTIVELAKGTFRGFKETYKTQVDEKKAADRKINERNNRWFSRRTEVHQVPISIKTNNTYLLLNNRSFHDS